MLGDLMLVQSYQFCNLDIACGLIVIYSQYTDVDLLRLSSSMIYSISCKGKSHADGKVVIRTNDISRNTGQMWEWNVGEHSHVSAQEENIRHRGE